MESTPSSPVLSPLGLPAASTQTAAPARTSLYPNFCIVALAGLAFLFKIVIALNTIGTNDAIVFYGFARSLSDHGLGWTYEHGVAFLPSSPIFNHPPLTAYYLVLIKNLSELEFFRAAGLTFPFLLRFPGIVADFVSVMALLRLGELDAKFRLPLWSLVLFAASPVAIMVSGFHGNTDSVMTMFVLLAACACARNRPLLCGLLLAIAAQIKIVPLLLFPFFFLFWFARRKGLLFLIPFATTSCLLLLELLLKFPHFLFRNIFSYSSYWGLWGITYLLRLTGYRDFDKLTFFNLAPVGTVIVTLLKIAIIGGVLLLAWRRRNFDARALFHSIAYAWLIFFVFSPGIGVQYLVWLAPFCLVLARPLYLAVLAAGSVFLFVFYTVTAGGFPWYVAVSTIKLSPIWAPWSLLPWATLLIGLFLFRTQLGREDLFFPKTNFEPARPVLVS
jgi:Glycosyltransferase family 87